MPNGYTRLHKIFPLCDRLVLRDVVVDGGALRSTLVRGGMVWAFPARRTAAALAMSCGLSVKDMLNVGCFRIVSGAGGAVRTTLVSGSGKGVGVGRI